MKASILTIGDELLNGSTLDTNASFMAKYAIQEGIEIISMLSVADKAEEIKEALDFLVKKSKIIFITGGLGPTKDDITVKTLADYVGQKLVFNEVVFERINKLLSARRKEEVIVPETRCFLPEYADLLENKKGTAPCMWIQHNDTVLVSMPGVPLEMKQIFRDEVLPKVKKQFKLKSIINKYIQTVGIWESFLAKEIEDIEEGLPTNISIAYLPKLGRVKLRITGRETTEKEVQDVVDVISDRIKPYIFSFDESANLAQAVGQKLKKDGKTVTIAESCSGGKLAHKITAVAGCSSYYNGSIITYSNQQKIDKLNVKPETLKKNGAVSEQTVTEMAKGVLDLIPADYSIAISGIAGPTGGTSEKPVGTVWIAVASKEKIEAKKFTFWTHRQENIELTSVAALDLLRKFM